MQNFIQLRLKLIIIFICLFFPFYNVFAQDETALKILNRTGKDLQFEPAFAKEVKWGKEIINLKEEDNKEFTTPSDKGLTTIKNFETSVLLGHIYLTEKDNVNNYCYFTFCAPERFCRTYALNKQINIQRAKGLHCTAKNNTITVEVE